MKRTLLVALAILLTGCERGCLSTWLSGHGAGGAAPARSAALDLSGTDCSDGLVRCVAGRVEASRAAHLPDPCGSDQKGACACPWDAVGRCAAGCAEDGLEVLATPDAGATNVCRPDAPVARPVLPGDPMPAEVCTTDGFGCVDGLVRVCDGVGKPVRPLAFCLSGCDPGLAIDHGDPATPDGAIAILCRRSHAERR